VPPTNYSHIMFYWPSVTKKEGVWNLHFTMIKDTQSNGTLIRYYNIQIMSLNSL